MSSKSIKRNSVYNAIKTISTILFPLITFPYISRVLLVENIGKINFGASIVSYFTLIASLGISTYAIRECSRASDDRKKLSKVASEIYSINIVTTIFAYFLLVLTLIFWKKLEGYRVLIIIQSLAILFATIGTDWINSAMEDFKFITIRTVAFQVLSIVLMFLLIKKPEDYILYAIITVISSSGVNIVNYFYRKKYCDIHFVTGFDYKVHIMPIIFMFVMILAQTVFNNVDMTMLGIIKGDYSVGIYSTAHKICNIISQLIASLLWVIMPRMSYYFANKDFNEINKLLRKVLNFNITIGFPCVLGTILVSNDIIIGFAGSQYVEASPVLKILMIGTFISLFGGSFLGNIVLLPMNREKYYMIVCVVAAFVNVILNYLIIPKFGAVGAGFTTVVCSFVIFMLLLLRVDKRIKIKKISKLFIAPIIGCIGIVIICKLCTGLTNMYIRVIISVVLSIIIYFIVMLLMKDSITYETYKSIKRKFKICIAKIK